MVLSIPVFAFETDSTPTDLMDDVSPTDNEVSVTHNVIDLKDAAVQKFYTDR